MAGIGWYFKYGTYKHGDMECWFNEDRQTVYGVEKVPLFDTVRWDIHVFLQRDTPALLKSAEIAMAKAYANEGQDAGFYLADGTPTAHRVANADTIRGVRVTRRPFFPESRGAEGVRWRNIGITLEWEMPVAESQVMLTWEQAIRIQGDGGPDWDIIAGVVGQPIIMPKTEGSKVVVIQSGRGVGMNYYPLPATPVWMQTPPLHGPSTTVDRYTVPGPSRERVVTWSYTFLFPTKPFVNPPAPRNFHL